MSWKPLIGLAVLALVCWLSLAALSQAASDAAASGPLAQVSPTPANLAYLPHIERAASLPALRGF